MKNNIEGINMAFTAIQQLLNMRKEFEKMHSLLVTEKGVNKVIENLFKYVEAESEELLKKDSQLSLNLETKKPEPEAIIFTEENSPGIKEHNEKVRAEQAAKKAIEDAKNVVSGESSTPVTSTITEPIEEDVPVVATETAVIPPEIPATEDYTVVIPPIVKEEPKEEKKEETVQGEDLPRFSTPGEAIEALYPIALEFVRKGTGFNNNKMRGTLMDRIIKTFPLNTEYTLTAKTEGANEESRRNANKKRNEVLAAVEVEVMKLHKQEKLDRYKARQQETIIPVSEPVTVEKKEDSVVVAPLKSPEPVLTVVDKANDAINEEATKGTLSPARLPDKTLEITVSELNKGTTDANGFTGEDLMMMKEPLAVVKAYLTKQLVQKGVKSLNNDEAVKWAVKFMEARTKSEEVDVWINDPIPAPYNTKLMKFLDRIVTIDVPVLRKAS